MIKGIHLYGPTYFSPLLNQFKVWIENCPVEKLYHILLILTDGDVHDLPETIDVIVSMSSLPVSIIIVGLGNEDFEKMEILDGDHGRLIDSKGNIAKKDLV